MSEEPTAWLAGLRAGTVWINTYGDADAAAPFGGMRMSGFGKDKGSYAMDAYTAVKTVWVNTEYASAAALGPPRNGAGRVLVAAPRRWMCAVQLRCFVRPAGAVVLLEDTSDDGDHLVRSGRE